MRQEVDETGEVSRLELWRRASQQGDLEAWAAFQQDLEGTVLAWFHAHPSSEAASRVQSESHFVARAFEQVWHLVVQGQVARQTLSEALVYLRASLCGAILDGLRVARCEGSASNPPRRGRAIRERRGLGQTPSGAFQRAGAATGLPALSLWPAARGDSPFGST